MTTDALTAGGVGSGVYRRIASDSRFRRLWIAQFVSGIGDWLVVGLLIPMVTALSGGSSFAVAGILIAKIVPSLLFSSVTGPLVDRFDRRKVMIAADITRLLLVLILMWTTSLFAIYTVVLLMETASLFFLPSRNSFLPALVDRKDLTAANGLMYTTQQVATILGLTASGAILAGFEAIVRFVIRANLPIVDLFVGRLAPALLGSRAGFFLDALTFLFSALVVSRIAVIAKPPAHGERFTLRLLGKDAIESFRFLGEHRELRGLLITIFLAILGGGSLVPVGVDYITSLSGGLPFANRVHFLENLSGTPQTFVLVFLAIGMAVGATVVPRLEHRIAPQALFAGSVSTFAVAMAGFAMVQRYSTACLFVLVAGVCIAAVSVAGNAYIVRSTADEIRGRVFTAQESVIRVAMLLSMSVMAPLNDGIGRLIGNFVKDNGLEPVHFALTGPRITLLLSAGIVFAAAGYALTHLRWTTVRTRRASETNADGEPIRIDLPVSRDTLESLRAGDEVRLYGPVFTARDATHVRLLAELERDGKLPFDLAGQTLFYAGPTPSAAGRPVGSVGPTTAKRMDFATPELLRAGIVATIGKGSRSAAVRDACVRTRSVYFAPVGGAAALLATFVTSVEPVAWADLGTEALVRMELDGLPVFVAIDTSGEDLYADAASHWRAEHGGDL